MNDEVQQIKERLDIVEIISSYLTVKKAGANLKANCPFHNEKTPSFMISPERQTFKCFGCGIGGDVFTFIEQMEGLDFYNALKILADKAGVKLQQKSVQYGEKEYKSDRKTRIYEINNWAKKLYHKILLEHPKAQEARNYLKKRGMTDETILEFEIGYAPDSWEVLTNFLSKKKYSLDEIVQSGLAVRNEKGNVYDRFRGRIMFPINNIMGTIVAFTSRVLIDEADSAKYLNSAESPIYIKGKTLYGLDKAKMAIKEVDLAVFVEGNMDVMACHQAGFKNVVATSGTAITEEQLKILSRYASEIALAFDTDIAGEAAMKKAVQLALKNDISTKVIALPTPFKDPDEAIKNSPKNWTKAIEVAKPSLEYWIDLLIRKNPDLEVLAKKKIAKEILPVIKAVFSDIEKEYYIKYLAKKLSVAEKTLIAALEKSKISDEAKHGEKADNVEIEKIGTLERIFGLLWHEPKFINLIGKEIDELNDPTLPIFVQMIKNKKIEKEKLPSDEILILNQYDLSEAENIDFSNEELARNEFNFLLGRLRSDSREKLKNIFAQKIQAAEERGDKNELKKLIAEFSSLIK